MRRGVIFTLDALVAVVIAITALTVITQLLSLRSGEWYKEIALYNSAQDFLTSRDKDGTLVGIFNQTDTDAIATLNTLISAQITTNPSMVARINVTVCTYEGSFVCDRNFSAGQAGTTQTESVVRRVFTNDSYYGIATMEVWYS